MNKKSAFNNLPRKRTYPALQSSLVRSLQQSGASAYYSTRIGSFPAQLRGRQYFEVPQFCCHTRFSSDKILSLEYCGRPAGIQDDRPASLIILVLFMNSRGTLSSMKRSAWKGEKNHQFLYLILDRPDKDGCHLWTWTQKTHSGVSRKTSRHRTKPLPHKRHRKVEVNESETSCRILFPLTPLLPCAVKYSSITSASMRRDAHNWILTME